MAHPPITGPTLMETGLYFPRLVKYINLFPAILYDSWKKTAHGKENNLYRKLNDLYDNQILLEPKITKHRPLKQSPGTENGNIPS